MPEKKNLFLLDVTTFCGMCQAQIKATLQAEMGTGKCQELNCPNCQTVHDVSLSDEDGYLDFKAIPRQSKVPSQQI